MLADRQRRLRRKHSACICGCELLDDVGGSAVALCGRISCAATHPGQQRVGKKAAASFSYDYRDVLDGFFFPAEDGIRDVAVTGVQTCALPISLILMASLGLTDGVEALLKKGAYVNAKDKTGWTALMGAARKGHSDTVRALLEKGAYANAKDNNGWTALKIGRASCRERV